MAIRTWIPLSLAVALLSACQTQRAIKESDELRQKGDIIRSVEVLQAEARQAPDDVQLRTANFSKLELLVAQYSREASTALMRGDDAAAIRALETILKYDPSNLGARQEIQSIQAMKQLRPQLAQAYEMKRSNPVEALNLVRRIIAQKPNYREALDFRNALTRELVSADYLSADLSEAMRKPLSLEFSAQSLTTIFETIARLSGVNFVIDKEVNPMAPGNMNPNQNPSKKPLNRCLHP
ncbi:general secretion pathway protein D, partial [Enterocytozoon bieneusi H348]